MSAPASAQQVLLLYRRILKAAQRFPSIKRGAIIDDIRREFREHRVSGGWYSAASRCRGAPCC